MAKSKNMTIEQVGLKYGFRSGLEDRINRQLLDLKLNAKYEEKKLPFLEPEKKRNYTPDFFIYDENNNLKLIIETKGRFTLQDRKKMLLIKDQYPELDIRMIFSNSNNKISKSSKTTYGMWCNKHNIIYADKEFPEEWLNDIK